MTLGDIKFLVNIFQVILIIIKLNGVSIDAVIGVAVNEAGTRPQASQKMSKRVRKVMSLEEERDIFDLLLQCKTSTFVL